MKILQIFGAVVAVHLLAFIFIFASPGCQSGPRNVPTPDATLPSESSAAPAPISYNANATPQPVDLGTAPAYSSPGSSGHNSPTRPGSPAAAAVGPTRVTEDVAPVSTYTIVKGDSLWSVAKKNHLTVAELAKANNLPTGAALKPGKKLMIPGKPGVPAAAKESSALATTTKSSSSAEKSSASGSAGADSLKHTVQAGESLGVIARKYQVSVGELAAVNNITDPSKVRAGQQLIIPGMKAVGSKANSTSANRPAAAKSATTPAASSSTSPSPASSTTAPAPAGTASPHFEITAPPPGQDLDAGLKEATTEVPTIKVEDSTTEQAPKK
jgi:LysM repeat protein